MRANLVGSLAGRYRWQTCLNERIRATLEVLLHERMLRYTVGYH